MFVHSESVKSGNILLDMCVLQGFTVKRTTQTSTYRLQPSVAKTNHYLSTSLLTLGPSVHHRISMLIRTIQTKHHVCTTVSHHYLATFLFILHLSTCSAIITVCKVKHGEGRQYLTQVLTVGLLDFYVAWDPYCAKIIRQVIPCWWPRCS